MWLEVFKSGTHKDSNGREDVYSLETLDKIASVYNKSILETPSLEAPVVKGHPKDSDPAYGWVSRLARRGSSLWAKLKDVSQNLIDEVNIGHYKKVSIALYPDLMLRHIGFIGAASPAVKGLKPVNFTKEKEFSEFISDDDNENDISQLIVKEAENSSSKEPEKNFTDFEELNRQIKQQSKQYENKIRELEKELSDYHKISEEKDKDIRRKDFREFAESLVANPSGSIILPSQLETVVEIMEMAFSAESNNSKEFTDDEQSSCLQKVRTLFSSLKPVFDIKEFATGASSSTKYFNSITDKERFTGKNISQERLKLHEKAREIQLTFPEISYEEAVLAASREI